MDSKEKRYFLGIFPKRGGGGHPISQNFCTITKSFLACQIHPKMLKHEILQYPCDSCDFMCERKKDLRYHMGEKHRHEQVSVKIETFSKKGEDGLYCCTMCPKKFTDPSNLRRHMAKTHYKILHFCTDCNYSAKRKDDIKHHYNNVHLGMKFPCNQCDHEATSPHILRTHERTKHN